MKDLSQLISGDPKGNPGSGRENRSWIVSIPVAEVLVGVAVFLTAVIKSLVRALRSLGLGGNHSSHSVHSCGCRCSPVVRLRWGEVLPAWFDMPSTVGGVQHKLGKLIPTARPEPVKGPATLLANAPY